MFGIGAFELVIILVIALIFIGPKKLPELARGLGKGIREFQKAKDDLMNHVNLESDTNLTHHEEKQITGVTPSAEKPSESVASDSLADAKEKESKEA